VAKGKKTTNSIAIRDENQSPYDEKFKERVNDLLQALNHIELLDDLLTPFVSQLKTNFISVFFNKNCVVSLEQDSFTVTFSKVPERQVGLAPALVFNHIKQFVTFVRLRLDGPLSSVEGGETFLNRLGSSISAWLCDSLIR
jgi:hypothetical protein